MAVVNDQIIADLAALPLIVRGSSDEVFKRVRELQEAARNTRARVDGGAAGTKAARKAAIEIANDRLGPRADAPQFWDKYAAYVEGVIRHHATTPPLAAPVDDRSQNE